MTAAGRPASDRPLDRQIIKSALLQKILYAFRAWAGCSAERGPQIVLMMVVLRASAIAGDMGIRVVCRDIAGDPHALPVTYLTIHLEEKNQAMASSHFTVPKLQDIGWTAWGTVGAPPFVYADMHGDADMPISWLTTICQHCRQRRERTWRCMGCGGVYYCSKACQLAHWDQHKALCMPVRRAVRADPKRHHRM